MTHSHDWVGRITYGSSTPLDSHCVTCGAVCSHDWFGQQLPYEGKHVTVQTDRYNECFICGAEQWVTE